jgi:hypothetical protein
MKDDTLVVTMIAGNRAQSLKGLYNVHYLLLMTVLQFRSVLPAMYLDLAAILALGGSLIAAGYYIRRR